MSDVPHGLIVEDRPHFEPPAPPPPPPPATWPPPPSPSRKRRPVLNVLAGVAIFVLFVLLGSAVGAQLAGSHPASQTRSTSSSAGTTTGTARTGTTATIDAAVVDITTTLDGGQAAGTGMIISADGLVLTNNHVIEGATAIKVQIGGSGPTHSAHIVGYSVTDDVAVVQIEDVS